MRVHLLYTDTDSTLNKVDLQLFPLLKSQISLDVSPSRSNDKSELRLYAMMTFLAFQPLKSYFVSIGCFYGRFTVV